MKHKKVAFFDVDETIVNLKTMFSFLEYFLRKKYKATGQKKFNKYMSCVKDDWNKNVSREYINREYYRQFKNENPEEIDSVIKEWFESTKIKMEGSFYIKESLELIRHCQSDNINIVFVSGSMKNIILPIANELDVNNVIATEVSIDNGKFTGNILGVQSIGEGKKILVEKFISDNGYDPLDTIAFGDHYSDYPMLTACNEGVIISDSEIIIANAISQGFSIIDRRNQNKLSSSFFKEELSHKAITSATL